MSFEYFSRKRIFRESSGGYPRQKIANNFWNWNISIYITVNVVFDGDYEFDIFLLKNVIKKAKIARYEPRLGIKMP
jgi:hypothetical protein